MKIKNVIALTLVSIMALNPIMTFANKEEIIPISAPIGNEEEVKIPEYIHFEGVIESIEDDGERFSVLLKDESKGFEDYFRAFIDEGVILLNDKTMDFADKKDLVVGKDVSIYYNKNTIMLMIYPPQLAPAVIIINENEDYQGAIVSAFDDKLLNVEGDLYIQPSDQTVIVDKDGKEVEVEQLYNKHLIAFYDVVRESYPAQTTPQKIVMMPIFNLASENIIEHNGKNMIPLRFVSESLGYEVNWNGETKTVELTKGVHYHLVSIGQDSYNFAKMHIELGAAPIIVNSRTYVPLNFLDEVFRVEVDYIGDGDITIKY